MAIRKPAQEALARLDVKTLSNQFLNEVRAGLDCSPVEAKAILQMVEEVFFPYIDGSCAHAPPGKMALIAVSADEPAGKPIADCAKQKVLLTLHRGAADDQLLQQGPAAFRRNRIPSLCQEALSQGGLLTREDLAYRVFFVSPRTISRDLKTLREDPDAPPVPLRSTLHDIGPVLTHRTEIVLLALDGKTTSQICFALKHSPEAVANYLSSFTRCAFLQQQGLQIGQIAFLLRRGKSLVAAYLELLEEIRGDSNRTYHLEEFLRIGSARGKKSAGHTHHG